MKLTLSRSLAAAALLGLATVGTAAHARTAFSIGFNVPIGGYYGGYYGPTYVAPPVAYVPPPAPVYYAPAPVYYTPAPVYYAPRVVYRPRVYYPAPVVGVGVRVW
jgi:hypothetical protein